MDFLTQTHGAIKAMIENLPESLTGQIDPQDDGRIWGIVQEEAHRILQAVRDGTKESGKIFYQSVAGSPGENSASNSASLDDSLAHSISQ